MTDIPLDYSRYFWQGAVVRLRPLVPEDAAYSYAASLDSPARQTLECGVELPTTVALQQVAIERFAGCQEVNGMVIFGIDDPAGSTVGSISLHSQDRTNGTFSFGIVIAREHWGRGYAREAVRILMRYGFWEQRYQKCNSACAHSNERSMQLHRALGFTEEGRRRRQIFYDGRYHEEVLWGMTREEFDALEGRENVGTS